MLFLGPQVRWTSNTEVVEIPTYVLRSNLGDLCQPLLSDTVSHFLHNVGSATYIQRRWVSGNRFSISFIVWCSPDVKKLHDKGLWVLLFHPNTLQWVRDSVYNRQICREIINCIPLMYCVYRSNFLSYNKILFYFTSEDKRMKNREF